MSTSELLIVGASGPIAQAIARQLKASALDYTIVGRQSSPPLDIADRGSVENVFETVRPRAVIYLANPAQAALEQPSVAAAAREGLRCVLDVAAHAGSERFVLASSAAVYGTRRSPKPIAENSALLGTSSYSQLKIDSERLVFDATQRNGMTTVSMRIFNVFGQGCQHSLLNRIRSGTASVWDTDRFVRDYIHVDDVAECLVLAARGTATVPSVINVGTGVGLSNTQLLDAAGGSNIQRLAYLSEPSYSIAEVNRATQILGFRAAHSAISYLRDGPAALNHIPE